MMGRDDSALPQGKRGVCSQEEVSIVRDVDTVHVQSRLVLPLKREFYSESKYESIVRALLYFYT
jgi:hypothetical protein